MSAVLDFLAVFVHSDVAGPSPAWWHWLVSFIAHGMIGVFFGRFFPRFWWPAFALLILKESVGDIPNAEYSLLVIMDSLSDQFAAIVGYCMLHSHAPNRSKKLTIDYKTRRFRMRPKKIYTEHAGRRNQKVRK